MRRVSAEGIRVGMVAGPSVLHVDTALEWRGGQVQLLHLVAGMAQRGQRVGVACPPGSPLWQALDALAAPGLERLPVPPGRSLLAVARLRRASYELLAAHTSHAHDLCLLAGRPFVVHRRVDFRPSGGLKYRRPLGYVCVSQAVARIVQAAGGRSCLVVPDGVAPLPPAPPAPDGPPVLAVGARVAHKGHRVLAEAAGLLPGLDIGVAGEGPLRWPGLRYLGQRPDVAALLAAARVFVHPSLEEGMGQAVVEAMLAGCPVVCSDAGGLPEVVGDTALVVPRGDAAALARAIQRALAGEHPDPALARARALRLFSVQAMVEGTRAAYEALLAGVAGEG